MHKNLFTAGILASLLVSGCMTPTHKKYAGRSAEEIYLAAYNQFKGKKFRTALDSFEEVERQYPASFWAIKGKLMAAYCAYKSKNYVEAIEVLENFLNTYPMHQHAAYAQYLLALCYYSQIPTIDRDHAKSEKALYYLQVLSKKYPNSEYTRDAQERINILLDRLAAKELEMGRNYQKDNMHIAAMGRFAEVFEKYPNTNQAEEATARLIECFLSNKMDDLARRIYNDVMLKKYKGRSFEKQIAKFVK